jgi:pilus assembly protein CpaD
MQARLNTLSGKRAAAAGTRVMLIVCAAAFAAGCTAVAPSPAPFVSAKADYRSRHPITVKEGTHTLTLFVGPGRGGLTPGQRAEVAAFAHNWRREATGGFTIDRPVGGPNERASLDTLKEVLSIIVQVGVPNSGIGIRPYAADGGRIAPLLLNYPQVAATAGPCGLWPDDLGPSYDPKHYENQQYHNFGCATQRNLASMVANPHDLIQPRSEAPIYTAKRTFGAEKWRKGESPATTYTDSQKGAISDLGK